VDLSRGDGREFHQVRGWRVFLVSLHLTGLLSRVEFPRPEEHLSFLYCSLPVNIAQAIRDFLGADAFFNQESNEMNE
jgi:hypothetical protein